MEHYMSYLYMLNIVSVFVLRWKTIHFFCGGKYVIIICNYSYIDEVCKHCVEGSSVPVISHTATIITLSHKVSESFKWKVLFLTNEHLRQRQNAV